MPGLPLPTGTLFEFKGGVGLSTEYTDNRKHAATDRESNVTTALTPSVALLLNAPTARGQLGYSLSGAHGSAEREVKLLHALNGTLTWQATPMLSFTATDSLTRSDEPSQADRLALRRQRSMFESNTFTLGGAFARDNYGLEGSYRLATFFEREVDSIAHTFTITPRLALLPPNNGSIGYEYLGTETAGTSTVSGHRLTATYSRQLADMRVLGLTGSWAIRDAENQATAVQPASASRFHEWSASLFNTWALPGRFTLRGSAGLSGVITTEQRGGGGSGGGKEDLSFTTQSGISYALLRGTLDVGLEQGYSETYAEGENLGIVNTRGITGSLSWAFTPSISASAGGYYRENEFTGVGAPTTTSAPGGAPAGGTERSWGGTLGVAVQVLRWFTTQGEYTWTQTSDSPRSPGFVEHRFRLSISRQF
jgi:hypothetical protein